MKKVLAFLLIFVLLVSTTVFALPDKPNVGPCSECGGCMKYIGSSYGDWVVVKIIGSQILYYREVTDYYRCNTCYNQENISYREYKYMPDEPLPRLY